MGSDFDFTVDANGQPQLLYIDKGQHKVNVEINYPILIL